MGFDLVRLNWVEGAMMLSEVLLADDAGTHRLRGCGKIRNRNANELRVKDLRGEVDGAVVMKAAELKGAQ